MKAAWIFKVKGKEIAFSFCSVLPDLGISEHFGEIFGDSNLVGIGLGKSENFGDKLGGFSYKMPWWNFLTLFINYDNYNEKRQFCAVIQ